MQHPATVSFCSICGSLMTLTTGGVIPSCNCYNVMPSTPQACGKTKPCKGWQQTATEAEVEEKTAITKRIIEEIRAKQKAAEQTVADAQKDLSGVESLARALEESQNQERFDEFEERLDRLEHMMITTANALTEVKHILSALVEHEKKIADDGK